MKKLLIGFVKYLGFYAGAILAIGALCFELSLVIYGGRAVLFGARDMSLADIIIASFFNGFANGVILGAIAVLFLTGNYYVKVGMSKLKRRKSK